MSLQGYMRCCYIQLKRNVPIRQFSKMTWYPRVDKEDGSATAVHAFHHLAETPRLSTGLEFEFLGTSSSMSTLSRNVSSLLLHFRKRSQPDFYWIFAVEGGTWMFDCGEGTVRQTLYSQLRFSKLDAVFISHLHGDHVIIRTIISMLISLIYGLPGLSMRLMGIRTRDKPTRLYAPSGIKTILGASVATSRQLDLYELMTPSRGNLESGLLKDERSGLYPSKQVLYDSKANCYHLQDHPMFEVKAIPIRHSIFCLGYVITEKEIRGNLNVEKLEKDYGVPPGPIYGQLALGKHIDPEDVMSPARRGRKIVILGDTYDPSAIAAFAQDADILVHECTTSDEERTTALQAGHSSAGMAGAFAKSINARILILNHFSPRGLYETECIAAAMLSTALLIISLYIDEESQQIQLLISQARRAFGRESVYAARVSMLFPHAC